MTDSSEQQAVAPPGEGWQWAFSFLRQDIQDLRAEIRDLRAEMNRRLDRQFTITISTMIAIGGMLAALIKL